MDVVIFQSASLQKRYLGDIFFYIFNSKKRKSIIDGVYIG